MNVVDFDKLISQFAQVSVEENQTNLIEDMPLARKEEMLHHVTDLYKLFATINDLQNYLESVLPFRTHKEEDPLSSHFDWGMNSELQFTETSVKENYESTAERPLLLIILLETIRKCRITEMIEEMADYLDENLLAAAGDKGSGQVGNLIHKLKAYFIVRHSVTENSKDDSLTVSRNYFTMKIEEITNYMFFLKNNFFSETINSLKLEMDREKLYCFSYKMDEDPKTNQVNPAILNNENYDSRKFVQSNMFKYKYAGGSHNVLYMQSLMAAQGMNADGESNVIGEGGSPNGRELQPHFFLQPAPRSVLAVEKGVNGKRTGKWKDKKVFCTTEKLEALCGQAKHFAENVITEELKKIYPLFRMVKEKISYLQALGETLSLMDMLLAFTEYTLNTKAVRPRFSHDNGSAVDNNGASEEESSTLFSHKLKDCIHPSTLSVKNNICVPNTIFWGQNSGDVKKLILTLSGPNNSGKTTLLRMLSQTQILAQIGCFVPAAQSIGVHTSQLLLCNKICAHLLCDTLPLVGTSSFKRELTELADVLKELEELDEERDSQNILLLFDELGRSTNTRESFALSCATMRYIIRKQQGSKSRTTANEREESGEYSVANTVLAVFSTHFRRLVELSDVFPEIDNFYFDTMLKDSTGPSHNRATRMTISHYLKHGGGVHTEKHENYGLELTKILGLPPPVVETAFRLLSRKKKNT